MADSPQTTITAARLHRWIDTKTYTPMYGVQVRASGKWHHLAVAGKAALYESVEAAEAARAELMRQVEAGRATAR